MPWIRTGSALMAMALFLLSCSLPTGRDVRLIGVSAESGPTPAKASLPATYDGMLACAGCPHIRTTLNMWPDGVYYLRTTVVIHGEDASKETTSYEIGRWALTTDGMRLLLYGPGDVATAFAVKSATRLRRLDQDGKDIDPGREADLVHQPRLERLEPRLVIDGMYTSAADGGQLKECLTERRFSVSGEARYRTLVDHYEQRQGKVHEPRLVTVEARIQDRGDETGQQHTIVVERFINIWPSETCGRRFEKVELENTYWKLVRLSNQPVEQPAGSPELYVRLLPEGRKLQGFAGCNRLSSSYERDGHRIRIVDLATTDAVCGDRMEAEERFMRGLSAASTWKIRGNHLELYGADGQALARFESRRKE